MFASKISTKPCYVSKAKPTYLLELLVMGDFDIGLNVGNAGTRADKNGHNFGNTEIAHGLLHLFADKGTHFAAV